MIFAGIDIGYGYTKVEFEDENKTINSHFVFKTAVEPYIKTHKTFGSSQKIITVNDQSFLVGQDASPNWQVSKDFVGTPQYYAVIGCCINKIKQYTGSDVTHIALGLPPSMFNEQKIGLIKTTIENLNIKVNDKDLVLPKNIVFLPQGVGIFLDFVSKNQDYKTKTAIVIDIGYYTLDMSFFKNGNFVINASKSYPSGVEVLYERVLEEFANKYGDFANISVAEALLKTGSFTYFGKQYNFDAKEILINFYIPEVMTRIKDYAVFLKNKGYDITDISVVICGGGGSIYLNNMIKDILFIDEPHMANARGYKNYLLRSFRFNGGEK